MMVLHDWLTSDAPRSNPRAQEAPAQQLLASLARIDAVGIHVQYVYYFWDDEQLSLYFGDRHLKPKTGRWTSRDPLEESARVNLYSHVENQPVSRYDPTGLWDEDMHDAETRRVGALHMSYECADRIARWDQGVDNWNGASLFPQYHFDYSGDLPNESPIPMGRDQWYHYRWEVGNDILARATTCAEVREALHRIGEAMHSFQDGFTHREGGGPHAVDGLGHLASTPFRHAPSWICLLRGDGFGIIRKECINARLTSPNWRDGHRPDSKVNFQPEWDQTSEETERLLKTLMDYPMMRCCCRRERNR